MVTPAGQNATTPTHAAPGDSRRVRAFIALGANLGERQQTIEAALCEIAEQGDIRIMRRSSLHETAPVGGPPDQPPYLNAVAELETTLAPRDLLRRLLQIEQRHGRVRSGPNAPRTLDLDLLLYGDERIAEPDLTLPHPRMWQRPFVLEPLGEIADLAALRNRWTATGVDVTTGETDWISVYRLCTGFITPRPIALVSTISADGTHNLAPFSFYNMVSANPPVVVFSPSLRRDKSRKHTLVNIGAMAQFVIATVTPDICEQMTHCAADLPEADSEFEFSGLTPAPATHVKAPLVKEARANIECKLRQMVKLGDQPGAGTVIFGDILAIHVDDDVLDAEGLVDIQKLQTVGRLGGNWYADVTNPYEREIPKV